MSILVFKLKLNGQEYEEGRRKQEGAKVGPRSALLKASRTVF